MLDSSFAVVDPSIHATSKLSSSSAQWRSVRSSDMTSVAVLYHNVDVHRCNSGWCPACTATARSPTFVKVPITTTMHHCNVIRRLPNRWWMNDAECSKELCGWFDCLADLFKDDQSRHLSKLQSDPNQVESSWLDQDSKDNQQSPLSSSMSPVSNNEKLKHASSNLSVLYDEPLNECLISTRMNAEDSINV